MSAVIERRPQLLSESGVVVPQLLEDIVSKALKKNREERYQTPLRSLATCNCSRANLNIRQLLTVVQRFKAVNQLQVSINRRFAFREYECRT
jgi:hypothetical protein